MLEIQLTEKAKLCECRTVHSTARCGWMCLINTRFREKEERKMRISKETANTGVAFYLLGG